MNINHLIINKDNRWSSITLKFGPLFTIFFLFLIFLVLLNPKSALATVDFKDQSFEPILTDPELKCIAQGTSTSFNSWSSPSSSGSTAQPGNSVHLIASFNFNINSNVWTCRGGIFSIKYRYMPRIWSESDLSGTGKDLFGSSQYITAAPYGHYPWSYTWNADNWVTIPSDLAPGAYRIGYVMWHYVKYDSSTIAVRGAYGRVPITLAAPTPTLPPPTPTPPPTGPTPTSTPTPPPPVGGVELQVVSISLDTPGPFYQGQLVSYSFTLRNNGSAIASDVLFQGFRHSPSKPACGINQWGPPPDGDAGTGSDTFEPGETISRNGWGFVAPNQDGTFSLGMFVDSDCKYAESNETNNYKTTTYTVSGSPPTPTPTPTPTPPPIPQPDLTITGSLDKTTITQGESITATVTITNQGTASTVNPFWNDFYISLASPPTCGTAGDFIIGGGQLGPLAAGESAGPFTITFYPSSSGTAYAFTDSFCDITESNELNNIIPLSYTVTVPCPEDFDALNPRGDISNPTPSFSWTIASSTAPVDYTLQMNTVNNFTSPPWVYGPTPNTTVSYADTGFPPLIAGTTYYWRVLADNGCSAGATISDHTAGIPDPTYPAIFTYTGTPAWFQTENNNIGAKNSMSLTQPPPAVASNFQTSYSAISGTGMTNIISQRNWLVKNYGTWSVPRSTFEYFWSKKGSPTPPPISYPLNGIYYNSTNLSLSGLLFVSGPSVIFVDGNLSITGNLTFASPGGYGVVFIVKGNITVSSTVTQINGFYIANGTFSSGTGGAKSDQQLLVNGAVIAHGGTNLQRDLGAGAGKNDDTPAEYIIFQPRYVVDFADLLGAPTYSWKEVPP
jgi:hypothetical protein